VGDAGGRVARAAKTAVLPVRRTAERPAGAQGAPVPLTRTYTLEPGQEIKIEIQQPDGARALVIGVVDAVPHAYWGGRVLTLRITEARACALPPRT
jgi:hypothetical protein